MRRGREDMRFISGAQVREEERRIVRSAVRDWTCRRVTWPPGPVRFVAAPPGHVRAYVSSAAIRANIRLTRIEELPSLEEDFARKALNVRHLLIAAAAWKTEAFGVDYDWAGWSAEVDRHVEGRRAGAIFARRGASVTARREPD